MPRAEGQPIPAQERGLTPDGSSRPSEPPEPESNVRAEASPAPEGKKPLDWNPIETATLTEMAKEMAALRDKIKAKQSTPAEELRLKKLVAAMKGMIEEKQVAGKKKESRPEGVTTLEEAERIIGPDFFGPEAIEKAFGIVSEDVPDVPYTVEQLEQAKQLGEMLVYREVWGARGRMGSVPLTLSGMQFNYEQRLKQKLLASDWSNSNEPAAQEYVRPGWALVSKDVLPGSTGKDYFDQTLVLYDHLVEVGTLPKDDKARLKLAETLAELIKLNETDWKEAAQRAAELPINAAHRRRLVEQVYDLAVSQAATGKHLLPDKYDWGSSRHSDGSLLDAGGFDAKGAPVDAWLPGDSDDSLGVVSVR